MTITKSPGSNDGKITKPTCTCLVYETAERGAKGMINELDLVVLNRDVDESGLKAGDVGTVVHCYADRVGYEVEFLTAEGKTVALLTLTTADIRPIHHAEILHVRKVTPALA